MDAIDLPSFLPSVGVLGLLAWLLIHVMRQASGDRGGYQQTVTDLRDQHAAELNELTARHNSQIADLRSDIAELRTEIKDLREQIEVERQARHAAEDQLAHYRRLAGEHDDPHDATP